MTVRDDGKVEVQVGLLDEVSLSRLFAPTNLHEAKLLLEGRGYTFEEKYQQAQTKLKGAGVVICSNSLPPLATNDDE
jgi:hypothetical protein